MIVVAYGVAAELPLLLRRVPAPRLPAAAAPVGLVVQAAGLALRAWSMGTLGYFYTRTLRTGNRPSSPPGRTAWCATPATPARC